MPRSPQLQKQISVMDRISRAMAELDGDDRATGRVVSWFMDEYLPEPDPLAVPAQQMAGAWQAIDQPKAAASGSKEQ